MFYAEIQDGHQKWHENIFGEKLPVDSVSILAGGRCQQFNQNHSISHRLRDEGIFAFYTELQDGPRTALGENHQVTL